MNKKKVVAVISAFLLAFGAGTAYGVTKTPKVTNISDAWNFDYGLSKYCDGHNLVYVWLGNAGVAMSVLEKSC